MLSFQVFCLYFTVLVIPSEFLLLQNIDEVQSLEKKVENLENELNSLKQAFIKFNTSIREERSNLTVGFVAELSNSIVNPGNSLHIIFDHVILNLGNGYNSRHGLFIAPIPGLYHFAVEITAPPQSSAAHGLHVRIMKKAVAVAVTFVDENTQQFLRRTASIILQLNTGDDVWCQTEVVSGLNTIFGGDTYSMFSGFLISAL